MTRDEAEQIIHDIIEAAILNALWDDHAKEAEKIHQAAEIFFSDPDA